MECLGTIVCNSKKNPHVSIILYQTILEDIIQCFSTNLDTGFSWFPQDTPLWTPSGQYHPNAITSTPLPIASPRQEAYAMRKQAMSYSADAITAQNDANKVRISVQLKVNWAEVCVCTKIFWVQKFSFFNSMLTDDLSILTMKWNSSSVGKWIELISTKLPP